MTYPNSSTPIDKCTISRMHVFVPPFTVLYTLITFYVPNSWNIVFKKERWRKSEEWVHYSEVWNVNRFTSEILGKHFALGWNRFKGIRFLLYRYEKCKKCRRHYDWASYFDLWVCACICCKREFHLSHKFHAYNVIHCNVHRTIPRIMRHSKIYWMMWYSCRKIGGTFLIPKP